MSEVWRPTFSLKECPVEQRIVEPPPSYQSLQALLQRGVQGFGDDMGLTVEVLGLFALPEDWTSKIVSI